MSTVLRAAYLSSILLVEMRSKFDLLVVLVRELQRDLTTFDG